MENRCLHAFRKNNKQEAIRLLQVVKQPRDVKDSSGNTLLHFADAGGWRDIVESLITKYNCDVNCVDEYNWTPVHAASLYGHLDVTKCLYNTGKCNLFIETNWSVTPLDVARLYGHHEIVEFITNVMTTTSTLACK